MSAEHSPGAMRAAHQWVEPTTGNRLHEESRNELAALIDRETRVPELLAALERALAEMLRLGASDNDSRLGENAVVQQARAALAKAKGGAS